MAENEETTPQAKPEQEAPAGAAPQKDTHEVVEAAPTAEHHDEVTGPYEKMEIKGELVASKEDIGEDEPTKDMSKPVAEEPVVEVRKPDPAPVGALGKQYRGDMFPAIKTPEMVERERQLQLEHDHPDAVPIEVYFSVRGIMDPGAQAARRRSTTVQQATMEKWDEIFKASRSLGS